ncbi:transcriptional regulator [Bradyrhizobium sp. SSBR45G]|uniref:helix-turn-helix transcriptional regulator n=1 Tax=unclassified Bradyrhizobium TaxID=2631580 RepID=UPI0023429DA9|nr:MULTISPECIES: LuxR family transcriptional regulator [unclassified Bradyrhizobium]GLH78136.1 transcriptional regulator [Bradyrhizobium sp. SSBR45G]GLH88034.1 transcriptional regulator [Bradyrhizobium sp. SSBR45R]
MESEHYAQALDAIYQGLAEPSGITDALESIRTLIGAEGATFEVIDTAARRPLIFHSSGVASAEGDDYLAHFAPRNPRLPVALRQQRGGLSWDYQVMDEGTMKRDPFYAEFLPRAGLRYFLSLVLDQSPQRLVAVTLQRSPRRGHVGTSEIALMKRLTPHLQRAYGMRNSLIAAGGRDIATAVLDLLKDGIALLDPKGAILHANPALHTIATESGLFRLDSRGIQFGSSELRSRYARVFSTVMRDDALADSDAALDFLAPRPSGLPACTISLRALRHPRPASDCPDAAVMMLVHDPLRDSAAAHLLQDLHGLTRAEAQLACALSAGMTAVEYAAHRGVKVTTVYTHLKRTREKTGWRSVAELTRRVHQISIRLRES